MANRDNSLVYFLTRGTVVGKDLVQSSPNVGLHAGEKIGGGGTVHGVFLEEWIPVVVTWTDRRGGTELGVLS